MWGYRSFAKEDVPVRETTGCRKPEMADCRTTIVRITPVNHPQQTNRIPTVGILCSIIGGLEISGRKRTGIILLMNGFFKYPEAGRRR